jgi:hypothetical protein
MTLTASAKPAPVATGNRLQVDRLGDAIIQANTSSLISSQEIADAINADVSLRLPALRDADLPEIPSQLEDEIGSWRRVMHATGAESARDQLRRAALDLFRVLLIIETGDPTGKAVAYQATVDALQEFADFHDIGADDAQHIISEATKMADASSFPVTSGTSAQTSVANVAFVASEWPLLDQAAFHGLAGEVVHTIEPHSEADPVAILLQALTLAGNVIGRLPYYRVESDQHHCNLFTVLVGASSKARKGTSMGRVRAVMKIADESWHADRVKGGLSSGEGFISEVRDEVKSWDQKTREYQVTDPGVTDKRLMIVEPEFASVLAVADRHGNTISPLIRRAWDGDKLATLTKNSSLCATDAHISIIGHITEDELRARITRTDLANGFGNRFLFALIRRSKELPFGGDLTDSEILHLSERFKGLIERGKSAGRVTMTDAAKATWAAVYGALSAGQPGLLGAVTARAEAQTIRLALIYALLDGAAEIGEPHLRAALAVWEYCEASAARIFGTALGDPIADEIEQALKQQLPEGMSRTAIRNLLGRHQTTDRIGAALSLLLTKGRARVETASTGGRPVETWFASGR